MSFGHKNVEENRDHTIFFFTLILLDCIKDAFLIVSWKKIKLNVT